MKRLPLSRGIYLLPSLCTTGNLFFGFYSIIQSIGGDFYKAALALFFAAFFDMLDGRIARLTHSETDFGLEYDSLVDLVSFGLAPGLLIDRWSLLHYGRIGWLAAFLFFACGALRLARYNVQIETVEKKRFEGLPIPAAALTLASFFLFYRGGYGPAAWRDPLALALTLLLAPLMVSRIRYRSFKGLDLKSRNAFYLLVAAVGVILVIASNPEMMLMFAALAYLTSGPLETLIEWQRRKRERMEGSRRTGRKMTLVEVSEENRSR